MYLFIYVFFSSDFAFFVKDVIFTLWAISFSGLNQSWTSAKEIALALLEQIFFSGFVSTSVTFYEQTSTRVSLAEQVCSPSGSEI